MSSNQTRNLFSSNTEGQGFGYTVVTSENLIVGNQRRSQGAFGWGGALGTRSWSDLAEELINGVRVNIQCCIFTLTPFIYFNSTASINLNVTGSSLTIEN